MTTPGSAPAANWPAITEQVMAVFPPPLRDLLAVVPPGAWERLEEIRLRARQPLTLRLGGDEFTLHAGGLAPAGDSRGYRLTSADLQRVLQVAAQYSLYALEEELRNAFLTLPGGHRLGLAGETVVEGGRVRTIKNVSSLNLRVARQIPGCASPLLPFLVQRGRWLSTLLFSPPGCGKTTLVRDLIRLASTGVPGLGLPGMHVGVVDERSEIAGCFRGVPQLDLGPRADVLDRCPKAEGMLLMIRAMGPQVLATDEIGRPEDVTALEEAVNAGVTLLATAHGGSWEELLARPSLRQALQEGLFRRLVLLGRRHGPGSIEGVWDAGGRQLSGPLAARGDALA